MRQPSSHITRLIALLLIAVIPWCHCRPTAAYTTHDATARAQESECCTSGCCSEKAPETPTDRCDDCQAACCKPRLHVDDSGTPIPHDTIGVDAPLAGVAIVPLSLPSMTRLWTAARPPGDDGGGRQVLLRSSILRT